MDIVAQVDDKETYIAMPARLGIPFSAMKFILENKKELEKCCAQCGRVSGKGKNLKQSLFQEMESLCATRFKRSLSQQCCNQ